MLSKLIPKTKNLIHEVDAVELDDVVASNVEEEVADVDDVLAVVIVEEAVLVVAGSSADRSCKHSLSIFGNYLQMPKILYFVLF